MKDNLYREDVRELYLWNCGMLKVLDKLNDQVIEFLGNDEDFNKWFLMMYDVFTDQFVQYVFSKTTYRTEKRTVVAQRLKEFIEIKRADKTREEEYRESRPDLYD